MVFVHLILRFFRFLKPTSLIHPRLNTLADIGNFVDIKTQPTKSIVTRAYFRATQNLDEKNKLGETPILNGLLNLESQGLFDTQQLPYIHGDAICGNMYTQHPDRLIPFWLRQKEMNLTSLLYQMLAYSSSPDLTTRPFITQCFMNIVTNLNDIQQGRPKGQQVLGKTEAEFVAIRRTEDIATHIEFLKNAFIIWSARSKQRRHSIHETNRSELIKILMQDKPYYRYLCHHFWQIDHALAPTMKRTMIWHDTDTNISLTSIHVFINSCYFQIHYGAKLVAKFLPKTPFDIDPRYDDLPPAMASELTECFNQFSKLLKKPAEYESKYHMLQKCFIDLNHHLSHLKYDESLNLNDLITSCQQIKLAQQMIYLMARINPVRYGIVSYLINQLAVYLSVTARVRDDDLFEFAALHLTAPFSNDAFKSTISALKNDNLTQLKDIRIPTTADHTTLTNDRVQLINFCHQLWRVISIVAPVHVTIADFGTNTMNTSLMLGRLFLPSPDAVLFILPEHPDHTKSCIDLFKSNPSMIKQHYASLGVLLGKSDQIKRSRAPFFTLSLNLSLARLIHPNNRYIGNGSTIIRGGTLTHLNYAVLGQSFGLGKTVQQGDGFRSIVNEYVEFNIRSSNQPLHPPSLFEAISLFYGEAPKEIINNYQENMASIIASGVLNYYPTEASRSHFKYKQTEKKYMAIMKKTDFIDRKAAIKSDILPELRAIPEANIALGNYLYPIEQDEKVAKTYHLLLRNHRLLSSFYSKDIDQLNGIVSDQLLHHLIHHRNSLSSADLTVLNDEIKQHTTPVVVSYAIQMVLDTLRQIPPEIHIRSRYIRLLHWLDPKQITPNYISIADSNEDLMSYRPI